LNGYERESENVEGNRHTCLELFSLEGVEKMNVVWKLVTVHHCWLLSLSFFHIFQT